VQCAGPFGQVLLAYYSGIGADSFGSGGINGISMAFFAPGPLAGSSCNFNDQNSACVKPAAGAGPSLGLSWAYATINASIPLLSGNTAPSRGGKPVIYFGLGGQSEGGASWDSIFSSPNSATAFGQNCAKLVQTVSSTIGNRAFIGIDLDIEGTSTSLPYFGTFVTAFRKSASFSSYPLMLDALSGCASTGSSDHFKVSLLQEHGPTNGGVNFLNLMVNNVQSSCDDMKKYWLDPALNFIPPASKIFGMWGENLAAWILKNPGCTDGASPLFSWMKTNGAGVGIWQWWAGGTGDISSLLSKIRQ